MEMSGVEPESSGFSVRPSGMFSYLVEYSSSVLLVVTINREITLSSGSLSLSVLTGRDHSEGH